LRFAERKPVQALRSAMPCRKGREAEIPSARNSTSNQDMNNRFPPPPRSFRSCPGRNDRPSCRRPSAHRWPEARRAQDGEPRVPLIALFCGGWFAELRCVNRNVRLDARNLRRPSAVKPQEGVFEGELDPGDIAIVREVHLLRRAADR